MSKRSGSRTKNKEHAHHKHSSISTAARAHVNAFSWGDRYLGGEGQGIQGGMLQVLANFGDFSDGAWEQVAATVRHER